MKIREASLRYAFSQDQVDAWFGSLGISGMSLNVIGRNLLTFTDYQGYDPEVSQGTSGTGSESLSAVDNFGYPNFRTFSAALEIIF